MGANASSYPQSQHDPLRDFAQVKDSPFGLVQRLQTLGTRPEVP